jgi:hypothetical protein
VIEVSPVNPNLLFASAVTLNTASGFMSEGVYVSTDGGNTWTGSDTCKGNLIQNHGGDPAAVITPNGRFVITHIGSIFPGLYSHFSTDHGQTWSNAATISDIQTEDKGQSSIDKDPASPYYGRLYASWVNIAFPYPVSFSYSSNEGDSWSSQKVINPNPPQRCSGGFVKTGPGGKVYVCWAAMTNTSPFTEDYIGFASSTDGGNNWTVNQNIYDVNGVSGTLPSKGNIRVNGLPQIEADETNGPRRGWLYIVTTEKNLAPAGSDHDIILHRSTDNGASWSAGIRVNQDALNNGKIQYFPNMAIDEQGAIDIIYYDDRNTTSDSAEVMLARSTDGGDSWKEMLVSDHRFKPKPIYGGSSNYQGDHVALLASGNKLYALWMDDFSGIYQVWLKTLDLNVIGINEIANTTPKDFILNQNYPNPFNPSTTISYSIPSAQQVSISVYDLLGREAASLVNEYKPAGTYEVSFNAKDLTSGIYFYKIKAGSFTSTRKMLLIK